MTPLIRNVSANQGFKDHTSHQRRSRCRRRHHSQPAGRRITEHALERADPVGGAQREPSQSGEGD